MKQRGKGSVLAVWELKKTQFNGYRYQVYVALASHQTSVGNVTQTANSRHKCYASYQQFCKSEMLF
jgi:hypothetical protein